MSHLGYGLPQVMPLRDTDRLLASSHGPPTVSTLNGPRPTKALFCFPTKQGNWQTKPQEASSKTKAFCSNPTHRVALPVVTEPSPGPPPGRSWAVHFRAGHTLSVSEHALWCDYKGL